MDAKKACKQINKESEDSIDVDTNMNLNNTDKDIPQTNLRRSGRNSDWDSFLKHENNFGWIAPVDFFKHVPFAKTWKDYAKVGMKIEVPNPFVECDRVVYWLATIRAFAGYKALIQYESFGENPPYFGWMSFCSDVPKPIGYCDKNKILLFPPPDVHNKHKDFLVQMRKITKKECLLTVSDDHVKIVEEQILSLRRFKIMQPVEAMDCKMPCQNRLGKVSGIIGDRIHVSYVNMTEDPGFWFNVNGERIHKIGWSQSVGHKLVGVPRKAKFENLGANCFPKYPSSIKIICGMVFEAIHPLQLGHIVAACVTEVFNYGYFMAEMYCNPPIKRLSFCFHVTSHWVLPSGFAERNNIKLAVPNGERDDNFDWDSYCTKKHVLRLDLSSLLQKPPHKFIRGTKMEAIDLRQPTFCAPVTVVQVAEHLLLLHFDGWTRDDSEALQWVDSESPEIYPAGWAEMVGHEFQSVPSNPNPEDYQLVRLKKSED